MKLTRLVFALAAVGSTAFGQGSAPAQRRLVCLFLDMNSKVLQEFTDNHESLLAALRAIVPTDHAAVSGDMTGRLEAIQAATTSLARFPERKALVYFAGGSPSNLADQTDLKNAISAAIRANVAIYAVDPSGLPTSDE